METRVINSMPYIVLMVSIDGIIQFANATAIEKLWRGGFEPNNSPVIDKIYFENGMLPTSIRDFLHEFDNSHEKVWRLLDCKHNTIPVSMTVTPSIDINPGFIIVAIEKQENCNKFRISELIDKIPVPIAILDADLKYTYANTQCKKELDMFDLKGVPYTDTILVPIQWIELIQKCHTEESFNERRDGQVTYKKSGKVVHVHWAISKWDNGGVIIICESVQELVRARESAIEASEQKSRFLANMSHELRTPLNGIIGFTDILIKELSSASEINGESAIRHEDYELLKNIKESGESLLTLINDILDFSKIEAGKVDIDPRAFSLRQCIANVTNLFDYSLRKKDIQFTVEFEDNLNDFVFADDSRLRQILLNIIGNSLKFTAKNGTILLQISKKCDDTMQFSVTDTGIGISQSRIPFLFESFVQAEVSTSRSYGGTGLGLAISKRLAVMMGGTMWVVSEEGVGSTFYFTIKVPPAEMQYSTMDIFAPRTPNHSAAISSKLLGIEIPLRILAAEDNEINVKLLKITLKRLGYLDVTIVENGKLAVDAAAKNTPFDIILMDLQMPVESGFEATQRIRKLPIKQPIIVALTAAAMKDEEQQAYKAGMDGIITKPLRERTIEMLFRKHFESSSALT